MKTGGYLIMEKENVEKSSLSKKDKTLKDEEKLPPCNSAPSAEHARSHAEDEPCDDGRTGQS
jgi:hypothetical protein